MNRFALIPTIALAALVTLAADDPPPPANPPPQGSPIPESVIEQAREGKAKRKSGTTRVLTNEDVKKSKGRIIERKADGTAPAAIPSGPSTLETQAAKRTRALQLEERRIDLQKAVGALEKDLAAIEQSYYDESDLDKRDGAVVRRFEDVKKQLDAAREALAAVLKEIEPPPQSAPAPPPVPDSSGPRP